MPRPSIVGQANNTGTAAFSLTIPSHQLDDLIIFAVETANEPVAAATHTANGYTEITEGAGGTAIGQGTAGGANATDLQIFWRRAANSTMPAIYVNASGGNDHQVASVLVIRNANTADPTPFDVSSNTRQTTNTTSLSFASLSTTKANTLIVHFIGNDADAAGNQMGTPTNATLTNLTEWVDVGMTGQDGGCLGVIAGEFAGSGSTGNTTATLSTTEIFNTWTVAIYGEPDAQVFPWAQAVMF